MPKTKSKTRQKPDSSLRRWGETPFGLIIVILGALVPVIDSVSKIYFSTVLLENFAQPEILKNQVQLITILMGIVFILVSVSIPRPRINVRVFPWRTTALCSVGLVWAFTMFMMVQLAPRVDNAMKFGDFPSISFTPMDTTRNWHSILAMQNIGKNETVVKYSGNQAGKTFQITNEHLAPEETWFFSTEDITGFPPGLSSATVSSSQPLYSLVVQEGRDKENPEAMLRLSYNGVSSGGRKLYFPAVKNNYHGVTSLYFVQNSGSVSTKVRARFLMENGKEYQFVSPDIRPDETFQLSLDKAHIPASDDINGQLGTVIIEANQPIVSNVSEHATGDPAIIYAIIMAKPATDGYQKAYLPERGIGKHIDLHLINVDSKPIDIKITYGQNASEPDCKAQSFTEPSRHLQPDSAILLPQDKLPSGTHCRLWANLEGTGNFLVFADETNYDEKAIISLSYGAHSTGDITRYIAVPFLSDHYRGILSTLQVRNPNQFGQATVKGTFHCTTEKDQKFILSTKAITLEPFGGYEFKGLENFDQTLGTGQSKQPNAWCSAIFESDQPILGYILESSDRVELTTRVNFDANNFTPIMKK